MKSNENYVKGSADKGDIRDNNLEILKDKIQQDMGRTAHSDPAETDFAKNDAAERLKKVFNESEINGDINIEEMQLQPKQRNTNINVTPPQQQQPEKISLKALICILEWGRDNIVNGKLNQGTMNDILENKTRQKRGPVKVEGVNDGLREQFCNSNEFRLLEKADQDILKKHLLESKGALMIEENPYGKIFDQMNKIKNDKKLTATLNKVITRLKTIENNPEIENKKATTLLGKISNFFSGTVKDRLKTRLQKIGLRELSVTLLDGDNKANLQTPRNIKSTQNKQR